MTEECIGEGVVGPVFTGDGTSILLGKFKGVLLVVASEVAVGELVAAKFLVITTVRSVENAEGGGW